MSNPPLRAQFDPDALQRIAEAVDSEDFANGADHDPHLELLPVSPGRFHAHWRLKPDQIETGRQMLGVAPEDARLVLRAYEFSGDNRDYAHARTEDFSVHGLDNHGYFDLQGAPESVGGVLGLVNHHGHFRPLLRGDSVALPQPADEPAPAPEPTAPPASSQAPSTSLNESQVLARLPRLTDLPNELLKAPDELAFFERSGDTVIEAASVELPGSVVLDESAVHDAVISGNCKILPAEEASASGTADTAHKPSNERGGASELLASQWSDSWDEHAPIHLRAELSVSGRLSPGLKLSLGGKVIRPLPGGYFKIVRKLNAFAEAWPLFSTIGLLEETPEDAVELLKDETGEAVLEIHASVFLEGRINDPDYLKFLPEGVTPDSDGRFSLHRTLPNGAVLLPGLSLLADG